MEAAIDNDEFIEYATFAGNMYGTSKAAVKTVMDKGRIIHSTSFCVGLPRVLFALHIINEAKFPRNLK